MISTDHVCSQQLVLFVRTWNVQDQKSHKYAVRFVVIQKEKLLMSGDVKYSIFLLVKNKLKSLALERVHSYNDL